MVYTIICNKRSYELPKKTVTVMEKLDQAITIDSSGLSLRDRYAHLHEFAKEVIGDEKAKEIFGSENLDEIDLSDLAITVRKIHEAYNKPINDFQLARMRETMSSIPMDKIASVMTAAEGLK